MKPNLWEQYGKSIVVFAYAVGVVAVSKWSGDKHIDASEGIIIALAFFNLALVYLVPLNPAFKSVKSVINGILAVLAVVQTAIVGGIDGNDKALILLAILSAIGVTVAPAVSMVKASTLDNAEVIEGKVVTRVGTGMDT